MSHTTNLINKLIEEQDINKRKKLGKQAIELVELMEEYNRVVTILQQNGY